jgi:hypothetical protein
MQNALIIIVIAVPICGIIAHALWTLAKNLRRTKDLRVFAEKHGYEFFPSGIEGMLERLPPSSLFSKGHVHKVTNLVRGKCNNTEFYLFDFHYTVLSGPKTIHKVRSSSQTVLAIISTDFDLPVFSLRGTSRSQIKKWFGASEILVSDLHYLSREFTVSGRDEPRIRGLLGDEAISFLESRKGLHLDGAGTCFILFRPSILTKANDLSGLVDFGLKLSHFFRSER